MERTRSNQDRITCYEEKEQQRTPRTKHAVEEELAKYPQTEGKDQPNIDTYAGLQLAQSQTKEEELEPQDPEPQHWRRHDPQTQEQKDPQDRNQSRREEELREPQKDQTEEEKQQKGQAEELTQ